MSLLADAIREAAEKIDLLSSAVTSETMVLHESVRGGLAGGLASARRCLVEAGELAHAEPEARSQAFFVELARETRKPHYGGPAKEYATGLLLRAQECGLYDPSKETT